ncbi:protease inhibitor I42 family protein [Planctomycetota bacterium]|nr:protease inhibitor I42 family protein [Planctomycetota bacterium]
MLKAIVMFFVMLLLMLVGACASDGNVEQKEPTKETARLFTVVRISDKDSGKDIKMWQGDEIQVTLNSNRTTGYMWMLPRGWSGDGVLKQVGEAEYRPDKKNEGMVGKGGTSEWRFKAMKPGKVELVIDYRRPWERTRSSKAFSVNIEVVEKDRDRRIVDTKY